MMSADPSSNHSLQVHSGHSVIRSGVLSSLALQGSQPWGKSCPRRELCKVDEKGKIVKEGKSSHEMNTRKQDNSKVCL